MMSRAVRLASRCTIALVVVATPACFSLGPPTGVQITCSAENRWCPGELECCNNQRCLPPKECVPPACADGKEPCAIDEAIDCVRGLRCINGCWQEFESFRVVCDDPLYLPCDLDGFAERWYCPQAQTCVVQISGGEPDFLYRGECYQPPTQCSGIEKNNCDCLTAPFSISPPCSPYEMCDDGYTACVACRERTFIPTDLLDANISEDVRPNELGASPAPECFESVGTSSLVGNCCAVEGTSANYNFEDDHYFCESGADFATSCGGYGDGCIAEDAIACGAGEDCLWSWFGPAGLHCAADGPADRCVDGVPRCVSGSTPRSQCDCVSTDCPG